MFHSQAVVVVVVVVVAVAVVVVVVVVVVTCEKSLHDKQKIHQTIRFHRLQVASLFCSTVSWFGEKASFGGGVVWVVVSNIFYFHTHLGMISILTNIFQGGWNHQPVVIILLIGEEIPIPNNHRLDGAKKNQP